MSNDAASVVAVRAQSGRRRTTGAVGLVYVDASLPLAGKEGDQEGQPANARE
jgi:hypothetical protein